MRQHHVQNCFQIHLELTINRESASLSPIAHLILRFLNNIYSVKTYFCFFLSSLPGDALVLAVEHNNKKSFAARTTQSYSARSTVESKSTFSW